MTDPPTDAELTAYIAGHLSATRQHEIDRWIAADPDHSDQVRRLRLLLTPPEAGQWDRQRIWNQVRQAIEQSDQTPAAPSAPVVAPLIVRPAAWSRGRTRWLTRVAAAIAVVVTSALLVHRFPWAGFARPGSVPAREYATGRGERTTVQLADGSRITLAPESRLRIAADFGVHSRSVQLDGEAEFEVIHDSTRQFSVQAGRARVVDIGTRFDLRNYAGDSTVRVAVVEGAVTLGPNAPQSPAAKLGNARAEGVLIRRGEVGRLDASGHARTAAIDADALYFGWMQGQLVFEREPLRDVLSTLSRWFDVEVHVPDAELANRLVTAEFSTQSAPEMIRALAQAVNASVVGSGPSITLVKR